MSVTAMLMHTVPRTRRGVGTKLGSLLAMAAVLMTGDPTRAEVIPAPGPSDARIRLARYNADEVYRLYGIVGYDIALEFAPDEAFERVNGGDLKAVTYAAAANTFTFKPRVRARRTNLTVTTNQRR